MENSYDVRGRQSSIFRLWRFDKGALIHMVFFRILIFEAPIAAFFLLLSLAFPIAAILLASKALIIIAWILFTPQLFAALRAFSLVFSRGSAFGGFNEYYMRTQKKNPYAKAYQFLPYVGLAVWSGFFMILMVMWFA